MESERLGITNNIEIYNMLGEKVFSKVLESTISESIIDISNQPPGIYLYRFTANTNELISSGKIIIQ
jgi:hypothetical protein